MILSPELIASLKELGSEDGARINAPGQFTIWREAGRVMVQIHGAD